MYCEHMQPIQSLLPEAQFIHIIRDGRDVAVSQEDRLFAWRKEMSAGELEYD
jgi:hypothetical protein